MTTKKRKLIDPYFQQRNYFVVHDETGAMAGMVYVLDTSMMPPNQRGGDAHENPRYRPWNQLCRMGDYGKR
ncbi:hypothetical protein [Paenibacillus monticola]|uniref:Uncharacterized protein n=1 Tax=Paenibacillus monticola TaxID=2666075 RepID=A0A7X2HB18_9BACL|nr:hypothetical protein [Paenibacillus monticola]MRN56809.1 hypothetical protein [Paenibacillus monticola]